MRALCQVLSFFTPMRHRTAYGRIVLGMGFLAAVASPSMVLGQATAPAVSLGSVAVGSSVPSSVTFTFTGTTAIGSVSIVTRGASGLDFQANGASTCVQSAPSNGTTCTVPVTFTPKYPGDRLGAVILRDTSGNALATGYIWGVGQGPLAVFENGNPTVTTSGLSAARGVSVDGAGNFYVNEAGNANVDKVAPDGTKTVLSSTVTGTGGAVDGAGNYYFGSTTGVYELVGGVAGTPVKIASGFSVDNALSVDGAGNLYVSTYATPPLLLKIAAGEASPRTYTTLFTGTNGMRFIGYSADGAGNLYLADYNGSVLYELPAGANTLTKLASGSPLAAPHGLALDAAGDIYITNVNGGSVLQYSPGTLAVTTTAMAGQRGIAVGQDGNLYTIPADSYVQSYVRAQSQPQTTSSTVGYSSPEMPISVVNAGNTAFTFGTVTAGSAAFVADTDGCLTVSATLASGAACSFNYQFEPTTTSTPQTGTLSFANGAATTSASLTGNVSDTAYEVAFFTPPATPILAGGNPGTVQAILEDANGYYVTTPGTSITLSSNYGSGVSYGSAVTAANGGLAAFSAASPALTVPGTYMYTAASTGLASGTANEVVTPGPASQLTATSASSTVYVGQAVAITVKALDQYGNQSTSTNTISLSASPSTATLPANFALSSGAHTANVTFTAAGTYTVTAADVTTPAVSSGTTTTITVQPLPTFTVTTLTDDATYTASNCTNQAASGATPDAACSLGDAVAAANAFGLTGNTGAQTIINFAPAIYTNYTGTSTCTVSSITPSGSSTAVTTTAPCIVLSGSTLLTLNANVNIAGPGPAALAVSGNNSTRNIFTVGTGSLKLTVSGLTLTQGGGTAHGGAFYSASASNAITFANDVFYNNTSSTFGGAVYVAGSGSTVTITNSSFDANTAVSGVGVTGGGAALYVTGVAFTISGSTFTNNTVTSAGSGYAYGGAIYASTAPVSTVRSSSFIGNIALSSGGVVAYGGAIASLGGSGNDTYTNVVWIGNTARSNTTIGYGGALYYTSKTITLVDSLMQGNTATTNATANSGSGGAIYSTTAKYLYNTTITGNYAKGGYGGTYSILYVNNSIVYGNSAGTAYADTNVVTANTGSLTNASNLAATLNPMLSAPSNTGSSAGPINGAGAYAAAQYTMLPLPGSPALRLGSVTSTDCYGFVNGVVNNSCVAGQAFDQRGLPRLTAYNGSTVVDAGSTESNYTLAFVQQPANKTNINTNFSPAPTVQIYESGAPFSPGTTTALVSFTPSTGSAFTTTPTVTGSTTGLQTLTAAISSQQTTETLTASISSGASGNAVVATAQSNTVRIMDTTHAYFRYTVAPPAMVVNGGNAGQVKIVIFDSTGAQDRTTTATFTLTVTGPSSYSKTYTAVAAGGFATFDTTADALTTSGTYIYTATATGYSAVASNTIVSGTVLGSLTVTGIPANATAGYVYSLTVTAKDTTGAVMTSFTGPVALTSSDSAVIFTPQNYTFNTSDAGVHTFHVALNTVGTQSVTATALNTGPGTAPGILVSASEQGIVVSNGMSLITVHPVLGGLGTAAASAPVASAGVVVKRNMQTMPSPFEVSRPVLSMTAPLVTPEPTSATSTDASTNTTTEKSSQCVTDAKPDAKCVVNAPR